MSCLFCRIVQGEVAAQVVLDEPELLAFRDIHPVAPTHILVIPKRHIVSLAEVGTADSGILGQLLLAAHSVAAREGVLTSGFRTVFNSGANAGQSVFHLHLHVLAGRAMLWPPG